MFGQSELPNVRFYFLSQKIIVLKDKVDAGKSLE